ncbi:MAG: VWA domain-containing protein [Acidobacteriota bacterium]
MAGGRPPPLGGVMPDGSLLSRGPSHRPTMRRLSIVRRAIALSLVLIACAVSAAAQEAPARTFAGATDTVLVEVPVEVTRKGEPVRGLTAENFVVLDKGKAQTITQFEVVDLQTVDALDALPIAARRHFLLLFDLGFAQPTSLANARAAALDVVDNGLHPADLVAIGTYSRNRGAQLKLAFTSDLDLVRKTLMALDSEARDRGQIGPLGLAPSSDQRVANAFATFAAQAATNERERVRDRVANDLAGGGDGLGDGSGSGEGDAEASPEGTGPSADSASAGRIRARQNADAERQRIVDMTRAYEELSSIMAGIDGRKHVVLFSEGFDSDLVLGRRDREFRAANADTANSGELWAVDSLETFGDMKTVNNLEAMVRGFRQADCMVHSVDVGGARILGTDGGRDGLAFMANNTGGVFYEKFNDLGAAMSDLMNRTSVTYLLAFQPQNLGDDGDYRKLKIKLRDVPRGTRVSHRAGYFEPDADARIDPRTQRLQTAQQLLDGREGGALATRATALPLRSAVPGIAYVPVLVEIEGDSILRGMDDVARADRKKVALELYAYAMDVDGEVADHVVQRLTIDRSQFALTDASGLRVMVPLALQAGDYAVRVLVRNAATGGAGLRIVPLSIADALVAGPASAAAAGDDVAASAADTALLPPMFAERPGGWSLVRATRAVLDPIAPALELFEIAGTPFVPAIDAALQPGKPAPVVLLGYGLQGREGEIASLVLGPDGQMIASGRLAVTAAAEGDGLDRALSVFHVPEGLAPGDGYQLLVEAPGGVGLQHALSFRVDSQSPTDRLLAFRDPRALPPPPRASDPARRAPTVDTRVADGAASPYESLLARIDTADYGALLDELARLEVAAVTENPERLVPRLRRAQLRVADALADGEPEALVPILLLHHDLCLMHKRERRTHLMHHGLAMTRALAKRYVEAAGGVLGARKEAARALASLGGHLQAAGMRMGMRAFDAALVFDSDNEAALLGLAAFHEKHGGPYEHAVDALERLVAAHPESREGQLRLALNLLRLERDVDRARGHLSALHSGTIGDWIEILAAQELARLRAREGDLDGAIALMRHAVERAPDVQKLRIQLAYLLDRAQRSGESVALLRGVRAPAPAGPAADADPARSRYNQWPLRALVLDRQALQDGAVQRRGLLAAAAERLAASGAGGGQ